ncbi:OLC1v1007790C1 [Oldenlandia corymbosa var. corymbosa]|uniref:OLC1v1007790C1 n=1 Tax=Oldenlandia corymbosa var. corymbosa TaxID=529605 RepID=A0AAV1DK43_OLDCO|nr:OLC1v1007790C1 [Oldenlandia corymbosa var. corymbosa]
MIILQQQVQAIHLPSSCSIPSPCDQFPRQRRQLLASSSVKHNDFVHVICSTRSVTVLSNTKRFGGRGRKKVESVPQNMDLPPSLPRNKKKPYPIPLKKILEAARADKKLADLGIEKPLEPPKNGLLVPDLIPIAYEVLDAWKILIKGLAQLLHVVPVHACSECSEVHVAQAGHDIQDCRGPSSGSRRSFHLWVKGSINDVLLPVESYHMYDPFGRRIKHETRFEYDRIPAVVELCIQAGVDLPEYPSRRRIKPIRMMGKKVIDIGGFVEEPQLVGKSLDRNSQIMEFDTYRSHERFSPPKMSEVPGIAQETMNAYMKVQWGVEKLMQKYTVKACGYCSEVHVGPCGHNAKLCGEFKHQWRDGKHGWQDATVDEVFPPNYVWHVRDPKGPPLRSALKRFYGKIPAVVEVCRQAGAHVPEIYKPMMRLDIVVPGNDEARLISTEEGNKGDEKKSPCFKWRVLIAYDGTRFSGWQYQPSIPTVHRSLEEALTRITKLNRENLGLVGAGRTDAGVHAWGQVAHYVTPFNFDNLDSVHKALNGLLPEDIRVREVSAAVPEFHARFSATRKIYQYKIFHGSIMNPLQRHYVYHSAYKLNADIMREAAQRFVGTHDFSAFCNVSHNDGIPDPVKIIFRFDVIEMGPLLQLEVEGTGFLYRQVRNMVALLLQVGKEAVPCDIVSLILASRDPLVGIIALTNPNCIVSKCFMSPGDCSSPGKMEGSSNLNNELMDYSSSSDEEELEEWKLLRMVKARKTKLSQTPCRTSALTGHQYVREVIFGHHARIVQNCRITVDIFSRLCDVLREGNYLSEHHQRQVSVEEALAMFLNLTGTDGRTCVISERFQHSTETVQRNIDDVVQALVRFSTVIIVPRNEQEVHPRIRNITKFYPWFKASEHLDNPSFPYSDKDMPESFYQIPEVPLPEDLSYSVSYVPSMFIPDIHDFSPFDDVTDSPNSVLDVILSDSESSFRDNITVVENENIALSSQVNGSIPTLTVSENSGPGLFTAQMYYSSDKSVSRKSHCDFNQVLNQEDKLGGRQVRDQDARCLRNFLQHNHLDELRHLGCWFTWSNNRQDSQLIYERLDRAFATSDWQQYFNRAMVHNLPIANSDHGPLILRNLAKRKFADPICAGEVVLQTTWKPYKAAYVEKKSFWEDGRWKIPVIQNLFPFSIIPHITRIFVDSTRRHHDDRLIWTREKHDSYTVKSGYHEAINLYQQPRVTNQPAQVLNQPMQAPNPSMVWKKLWNSRVQPKLKMTFWRAISNALPTRTALQKRGIPVSSTCP